MTEDQLAMKAMHLDAVLSDDFLHKMAYNKAPPTHEIAEKVGKSVSKALREVMFSPGSVLSIVCKTYGEASLASGMVKELTTKPLYEGMNGKVDIVKERGNTAHFEFTNNSAIYIVVTK